uniref:Arginine vasopressin-induced protein 1/transcriptional and immune response regulator domain-containing protein n=1 Tax=Eptatretus burgeri TaxID=7764 RepID=A0A8C4R571_EPTBU
MHILEQNNQPPHEIINLSSTFQSRPDCPVVTSTYRASTRTRRDACGNIFAGVREGAVRNIFLNAGDKQAEERAHLVSGAWENGDELGRAVHALKERKDSGLRKLLRLTKRALRIV